MFYEYIYNWRGKGLCIFLLVCFSLNVRQIYCSMGSYLCSRSAVYSEVLAFFAVVLYGRLCSDLS